MDHHYTINKELNHLSVTLQKCMCILHPYPSNIQTWRINEKKVNYYEHTKYENKQKNKQTKLNRTLLVIIMEKLGQFSPDSSHAKQANSACYPTPCVVPWAETFLNFTIYKTKQKNWFFFLSQVPPISVFCSSPVNEVKWLYANESSHRKSRRTRSWGDTGRQTHIHKHTNICTHTHTYIQYCSHTHTHAMIHTLLFSSPRKAPCTCNTMGRKGERAGKGAEHRESEPPIKHEQNDDVIHQQQWVSRRLQVRG